MDWRAAVLWLELARVALEPRGDPPFSELQLRLPQFVSSIQFLCFRQLLEFQTWSSDRAVLEGLGEVGLLSEQLSFLDPSWWIVGCAFGRSHFIAFATLRLGLPGFFFALSSMSFRFMAFLCMVNESPSYALLLALADVAMLSVFLK